MKVEYKENIIANKKGYMITYHERVDDSINKLIITFGTANSHKSTSGFGTEFLKKYGFNTVYIAPRKYSFYQELSLEDFKTYVKPLCEGKEVFTYGTSLGGYAAIYYAGVVNARAVAFSPRLSQHPLGKEHKVKFSEHNVPFLHIDMQKSSCENGGGIPVSSHKPFVIYDPKENFDNIFLCNVINNLYPSVEVYEALSGGHFVVNKMRRVGILKEFILTVINDNRIPHEIQIDSTKDVRYQEKTALNYVKNREFDKANKILEEVFKKSDCSLMATGALRRLVLSRASTIYPTKELVSTKIKNKLIGKHIAKMTKVNNEKDAYLLQVLHHESMLDFDMALLVAKAAVKKFGSEEFTKKQRTLKNAIKFIESLKS